MRADDIRAWIDGIEVLIPHDTFISDIRHLLLRTMPYFGHVPLYLPLSSKLMTTRDVIHEQNPVPELGFWPSKVWKPFQRAHLFEVSEYRNF